MQLKLKTSRLLLNPQMHKIKILSNINSTRNCLKSGNKSNKPAATTTPLPRSPSTRCSLQFKWRGITIIIICTMKISILKGAVNMWAGPMVESNIWGCHIWTLATVMAVSLCQILQLEEELKPMSIKDTKFQLTIRMSNRRIINSHDSAAAPRTTARSSCIHHSSHMRGRWIHNHMIQMLILKI